MAIPPDPTVEPAVEPAAPAVPEPAPAVEPAAPEAPATAPWTRDLEERFTDEAVRGQVDAYLRETQQPYITKLEQERKDALEKTWVFDQLNEDPAAALRDIATQVYGEELGGRIAELVADGATEEEAVEEAVEEAETDMSELPAAVRETVEWAAAEKARQTEAAAELATQEAAAEYTAWVDKLVAEQPDVRPTVIAHYVVGTNGDLEAAVAAYRADFPAPKAPAPTPPPVVGGQAPGGIQESRRMSTLAEAAGSVFDAARGRRA